jgi:membrane dipeptidase
MTLDRSAAMLDRGLLDDSRKFHDRMTVVNGLDASGFNEKLVANLREGGVDVDVVGFFDHRLFRERPDEVFHGVSVRVLEQGVAAGRTGIVFGSQSPDLFEGNLDLVPVFHQRGLRVCGLAYNVGNEYGSGCVDPDPGGLSHLGVALVEALQAQRIVVDIGGHCSEATAFDALTVAKGTVICSHTNARAIRNSPRATTDELIRAIADRGGVVGITAFRHFVAEPGARATVSEYVDHIDHVVKLVGADHVGLGFDFIYTRERTGPMSSAITFPPQAYPQTYEQWIYVDGIPNHSGAPLVTAELLKRGHRPDAVEKIMGRNWLRVWKEVWGE